jgi:ribosomal-protein-alanine N-acetyltransferase
VTEVSTHHFPILSTNRLKLRAIAPRDVAELRALMAIPEVTRYSNWPEAPTDDQANESIRNLSELFPSGKGCAWVLEQGSSGAFIGAIHFNYFYWDWRVGGIGYETHPDYWGRGFTTEALRAVVVYGHRFLGLNRIETWTLPGREPCACPRQPPRCRRMTRGATAGPFTDATPCVRAEPHQLAGCLAPALQGTR